MKALRNIFIGLLVLTVALFAAAVIAAGNVRFVEFVLFKVLQQNVKGAEVQEFSIGSLGYIFPSSWKLNNVRATVLAEGQQALITVEEIDSRDVFHLLSKGKQTGVVVSGAGVSYDELKVSGAWCTADLSRSPDGISHQGTLTLGLVTSGPVCVSGIKTEFAGNERFMELSNLTATVYGGKLSGTISSVLIAPAGYDLDIELEEVDTGELERALGGFFRELGGKLSGRLHVVGTGKQVDVFDTRWTMPHGGAISAELLSAITQYIPDSVQKKRIDTLIKSGGKLAVEYFLFTLKNDSPEQLSGQIGLKSREANLELNVTHEIRVDTRIDSLWQLWQSEFM